MSENVLQRAVQKAGLKHRRLVAPLMGFPGLNLTGGTIKLAQQNYGAHYKVIKALAETFEPDIIFPLMDLSVEANALGRYTVFPKKESATVVKEPFDMEELDAIREINVGYDTRLLGYVETLKLVNIGLPSSVIRGAYVTGPYTLASLMMGSDETAMATIIRQDDLHQVCQVATEKIRHYVRLLITAGAQVICILEPSSVLLGPEQFEQFSVHYVKQIIDTCRHFDISSVYHVCGNTMHLIEIMAASGIDALSMDSPETGIQLPKVAERTPPDIIVFGNINPTGAILNGPPEEVEKKVLELLRDMDPYPNFILSTGCDLPEETPVDNVHAFMQAGRNYEYKAKGIKS